MDRPAVVIAGPTCTGKSDTAVELALRIGGEVVSADSMQVYRGMDIGTAKIPAERMRGVPHHMIDIADPDNLISPTDIRISGISQFSIQLESNSQISGTRYRGMLRFQASCTDPDLVQNGYKIAIDIRHGDASVAQRS